MPASPTQRSAPASVPGRSSGSVTARSASRWTTRHLLCADEWTKCERQRILARRRSFGKEDIAGPTVGAEYQRRAVVRPRDAAGEHAGLEIEQLTIGLRARRLDDPQRSDAGTAERRGGDALAIGRPDDR